MRQFIQLVSFFAAGSLVPLALGESENEPKEEEVLAGPSPTQPFCPPIGLN